MKRFLLLAILALVLISTLSAQEAWYYDKEIDRFEYTKLENISTKNVDNLLKKYVGKPFSDDLIYEIDSLLYSQPWIDYYLMDARDDNGLLVLSIEFYTLPQISKITFEGNDYLSSRLLEAEQHLTVGSYFSPGLLRSNKQAIEDYYRSKGYLDAVIDVTSIDKGENSVEIKYTIEEGLQYKVSKINFNGISAISQKELTNLIETKERSFFRSGNYVKATFDSDLNKILSLYQESGYVDAAIEGVNVTNGDVEKDRFQLINIEITINEGSLWRLGDITFEGNKVFSDDVIQNAIYLEKGNVNNYTMVVSQLQAISSLYYNDGYIQTQIIPNEVRNEDDKTISYHINIVESKQSFIEEILITGLTKTKPYVFERELELKVGDVFSQAKLQKSGQNILNTSIVTDIQTGLYQGKEENGVILELAIEEGNQMELQFGATFGGTVDGFPVSGFLQWNDKNLFGTGRDFSIMTNLSPDDQVLSLSLSDSFVNDLRWANGISLSFERSFKKNALQRAASSAYFDGRDKNNITFPKGYGSQLEWKNSNGRNPSSTNLMNYEFYSASLSYSTGYTFMFTPGALTLSSSLSIGLSHAVYDDNYDPYEYLIKKYHDGWQFSNKLSLSLTWDARDLINNTTSGYVAGVSYTYAGGILGGLSNYNKISLNLSGFRSLMKFTNEEGKSKHLVLSLSSQISLMLPQYWNNSDLNGYSFYDAYLGATKYEMLYLDGMNIGRGHNLVLWNSFLWHNQVEVNYPLVENVLSFETYISATALQEDLKQLNNLSWYFSLGTGIKLRIPGFPLGLYLCKTGSLIDNKFVMDDGPIFDNLLGLKLVLAITTSIY